MKKNEHEKILKFNLSFFNGFKLQIKFNRKNFILELLYKLVTNWEG